MLENAVVACPEELWGDRSRRPEFWHLVFHTLFFLDLHLSESLEGFAPPAPFTRDELDPAGVMPERVYTKGELLDYLAYARRKGRQRLEALTEEQAGERRRFGSLDGTVAELLLYTLRHVQHHATQLNLILRQTTDSAPRWVRRAESGA